MKRQRRATIIDVGRHAGVSAKTVSRVFNAEPHVSEDLKQRVHAAAKALNYHPNMMARALVRQRSYLIGLVYENPSPSYVTDLQMGVLQRLRDEKYQLVVLPVTSIAERAGEVVGVLRSAALDGVILAPPASDHPGILADLTTAGIRFARIAPTRLLDAAPGNTVDDVTAAREIADYLIALGHRDIAIIKGDPTHASSEARLLGYSQAFFGAGLPMRLDRIEPGDFTRDSGHAAAARLLDSPDRPTAILAQNDEMAVGALIAARERSIAVPDQLSIVGFDDSDVARVALPALTTVRQPVFEMAVEAADMVIAQLEGAPYPMLSPHRHELIIRQSASAPPS